MSWFHNAVPPSQRAHSHKKGGHGRISRQDTASSHPLSLASHGVFFLKIDIAYVTSNTQLTDVKTVKCAGSNM